VLQSIDIWKKYDNPLHSSFTNNFPNLYVVLQKDKWRCQRMHHLVERPSENSYGKRFVIFQVVLPLQFFLLSKLCKFWQHWFANFCFCQYKPELPRFFFSYYNRSRAKLHHSVYFNSILDIPRPILSLWSLPIFAFCRSAQNGFVSKNHQICLQ